MPPLPERPEVGLGPAEPRLDRFQALARIELEQRLLVGERVREQGVPVETGRFAADMKVALVNDGPATFILDSRESRS